MRVLAALWTLLAASLVGGCSSGQDIAIAERAVERFHQQLSAQQIDAIYDEAAEDFQRSDGREQITSFLKIVANKLGKVQSTKKVSWGVDFHVGNTTVTLGYETEFQGGTAKETFVYRIKDGRAHLLSYNVQSNALIMK
jgi:hypothetical protein